MNRQAYPSDVSLQEWADFKPANEQERTQVEHLTAQVQQVMGDAVFHGPTSTNRASDIGTDQASIKRRCGTGGNAAGEEQIAAAITRGDANAV